MLDIHDLALARERGRDLVGVMAFVQTPLAAVFASPAIARRASWRAGASASRAGRATTRSCARLWAAPAANRQGAGREGRLHRRARPVHRARGGATGFWHVEGVELRARRPGLREFRVDDYGAPAYPELVLVVTRQTLQDRPALVRATIAALARGYEEVLSNPENGVTALADAVTASTARRSSAQLDQVSPSFTAGARGFGELNRPRLEQWARWEHRVGITKRVPEVGLAFDGRYVPAPGRD